MANWESGLSGAASGAAAGSAILPGWGTAIGGVIGGITGLFGSSSSKKKKKKNKLSRLDPAQQQLHEQHIASLRGEGPGSQAYNFDAQKANANFDESIGKAAYRSFGENVIPKITGQHRKEGLMNSSYSGEALSRAGRDVQEHLNGLRSDYLYKGEQASYDRKLNATNSALQRQTFDYEDTPNQGNVVDKALEHFAPTTGKWLEQQGNDAFDYIKKYLNPQQSLGTGSYTGQQSLDNAGISNGNPSRAGIY